MYNLAWMLFSPLPAPGKHHDKPVDYLLLRNKNCTTFRA